MGEVALVHRVRGLAVGDAVEVPSVGAMDQAVVVDVPRFGVGGGLVVDVLEGADFGRVGLDFLGFEGLRLARLETGVGVEAVEADLASAFDVSGFEEGVRAAFFDKDPRRTFAHLDAHRGGGAVDGFPGEGRDSLLFGPGTDFREDQLSQSAVEPRDVAGGAVVGKGEHHACGTACLEGDLGLPAKRRRRGGADEAVVG